MMLIVLISAHEEFSFNKNFAYVEKEAYFIHIFFFDEYTYSAKGTALGGYIVHAFFQSLPFRVCSQIIAPLDSASKLENSATQIRIK
jgi:hypothetical protein